MGYASLYGKQVALDWQTGTLYKLDLNTYSDQLSVGGTPGPCFYARSFPHLMAGFNSQGQQVLAEGRMVQHDRFLLDIDCGNVPQQASPPVEPLVTLKWSDDRGHSWNEGLLQTIGELGQYGTRPEWGGLGQAMDRIYDVSWSLNGPATLNGAWVEGRVLAR